MAKTNTAQSIEALAAEIGENIYIDVAKWHLYLREAHLHTTVAEKIYPLLMNGNINSGSIGEVLQGISIKLGGGKRELPLSDLVPAQGQSQLVDIVLEFQRNL